MFILSSCHSISSSTVYCIYDTATVSFAAVSDIVASSRNLDNILDVSAYS